MNQCLVVTGVKLHSVTSRVKDFASLSRKAAQRKLTAPFDEVRDIVGIRVVCLFLTDIPVISSALRSAFDIQAEDDKMAGSDVTSFGYMSLHLEGVMKASHSGPRYNGLMNLPLEIQVRTIAMDAWANVSHYLSYKADVDVPDDLKRDFHALSGLFYVADKHFELFYRSSVKSREAALINVTQAARADLDQQPLNADTLTAYLSVKFPDREGSTSEQTSEVLGEMLHIGITNLGQIDKIVDATAEAFTAYESASMGTDRFAAIGALRAAAYLYKPAYLREALNYQRLAPVSDELFNEANADFAPHRSLIRNGLAG